MLVQLQIQSTFEIATVTGNVNGHIGTLTYDGNQYFYGTILLTGLQKGVPLQLTVTVTDAFNNQQSAFQDFIFAPPPKINIVLPYNEQNIYLSFPLKANCVGIDTCTLRVWVDMGGTVFQMNFSNEVDTIINLQPPASAGTIQFRATDRWGQETYYTSYLFYDNNTWLSPIYSGTGKIYDFNYNKALVVATDPLGFDRGAGTIVDITTNTSITPTIVGQGDNYF